MLNNRNKFILYLEAAFIVALLVFIASLKFPTSASAQPTRQIPTAAAPSATPTPAPSPTPLPTIEPTSVPTPEPTEEPRKEIENAGEPCMVDIVLYNSQNIMFARYDINVYLDDQKIGTISNGDRFSNTVETTIGYHTLTLAEDSVNETEEKIAIEGESTVSCIDKAHTDYIEIEDLSVNPGIVASIEIPNVVGMLFSDAKDQLEEIGFINVDEDDGSDIWVKSNWIVLEQNYPAGEVVDKKANIVLTCQNLDDYFNEQFTGKTIAEIEDFAAANDWNVRYWDTNADEGITNEIKALDNEQRQALRADDATNLYLFNRTALVYVTFKDTNAERSIVDDGIPTEYKAALRSADTYCRIMHFSKAELYRQLTSEYGENLSAEAAEYAINNVRTDWKENALKSAQNYSEIFYMSKAALYDQLTSEYGDAFTAEEAQYAVDNVNADWNSNALKSAKTYRELMNMSDSSIYNQLISEYGERFTAEQAQYAIDHLND